MVKMIDVYEDTYGYPDEEPSQKSNIIDNIEAWLDTVVFDNTLEVLMNDYHRGQLTFEWLENFMLPVISTTMKAMYLGGLIETLTNALGLAYPKDTISNDIKSAFAKTNRITLTRKGLIAFPDRLVHAMSKAVKSVEANLRLVYAVFGVDPDNPDTPNLWDMLGSAANFTASMIITEPYYIFLDSNRAFYEQNKEELSKQLVKVRMLRNELTACELLKKEKVPYTKYYSCRMQYLVHNLKKEIKNILNDLSADPLVLMFTLIFGLFDFINLLFLNPKTRVFPLLTDVNAWLERIDNALDALSGIEKGFVEWLKSPYNPFAPVVLWYENNIAYNINAFNSTVSDLSAKLENIFSSLITEGQFPEENTLNFLENYIKFLISLLGIKDNFKEIEPIPELSADTKGLEEGKYANQPVILSPETKSLIAKRSKYFQKTEEGDEIISNIDFSPKKLRGF
jgi:hypothetical protein